MAEVDDEQRCIQDSLAGDETAYTVLVQRYQQMIHALTYRMTGSLHDADDLAKETFIRAFHRLGNFRGEARFSTWLCRIAMNACLNWRQREGKRAELHHRWADERLKDDPPGGIAQDEASQRVQAALARLPAKQRAAVVLTIFEGMNHAEAARVLGCTEATISWRLFAARNKLKLRGQRGPAAPDLYRGRINEPTWQGAYREVEAWPIGWCLGSFSLQGKLVMEATTMLHRMATESPQHLKETRQLAGNLAVGLEPQLAAYCFEAEGEFERALELVNQALRHPSPFPPLTLNMHPTPEQTAAKTLRRQKIQILQKLGKPAEAAAYACAEAERMHADADAQWAAVSDAADASAAAGKSEKALNLLASFVRQQEQTGTMTSQSAAARLRWADEEIAQSNFFEASEILRAVVKESEGKGWGVYLRTGYAKAYDAAIERLARLRTKTSAPLRN